MDPKTLDVLLTASKATASVLLIGLAAGLVPYSQGATLRIALIAGASAATAYALRLLLPAAAIGVGIGASKPAAVSRPPS